MTFSLRDARPGDVAALVAVEAECFPQAAYSRMSPRQFRHHVSAATSMLRVLCDEADAVAGYALGITRSNACWMRFYSLAVAPRAQGGEAGRLLFADFEEQAMLRGRPEVLLEIRADNRKLLDRYLKLGYRVYREVADYYPDHVSCLKMRRALA